jgi:hypothetical protein
VPLHLVQWLIYVTTLEIPQHNQTHTRTTLKVYPSNIPLTTNPWRVANRTDLDLDSTTFCAPA